MSCWSLSDTDGEMSDLVERCQTRCLRCSSSETGHVRKQRTQQHILSVDVVEYHVLRGGVQSIVFIMLNRSEYFHRMVYGWIGRKTHRV